jgi:hypothetical protein
MEQSKGRDENRLVAVELTGAGRQAKGESRSELEVILTNGRRIEVRRDFDVALLRRVVLQ